MSGYDDIIHLPHHVSATRPRMTSAQRAAQFSAFAALRGFDEEIEETARYTEAGRVLSEEKEHEIAETLSALKDRRREVYLYYFEPDSRKEGGAYLEHSGPAKATDGSLVFSDGLSVSFDQIVDLVLF